MKTLIRCSAGCLALSANVHAITVGTVDAGNTYSSVGYTFTGTGLGSVVALDPYWVLTAAHVVEADPVVLVMGDPNTGAEGIYFFFDQVVIHPDYVSGEFHDDLALINLNAVKPIIPVPGDVDASFATLSNVDLHGGLPATATLTGYGLTAVDGTLDPSDPVLRRIGVAATDPVGPPPPTPPFDPGFPFDCSQPMLLCAYGTSGGAPGDSGGAMWLDYGGDPVVAAIMSFVFDENDLLDPPEAPNWEDGYWTVGTSVAYYKDWIQSHVPNALFGGAPVPIPAAFWLLGGALLVMGAVGGRRQAGERRR